MRKKDWNCLVANIYTCLDNEKAHALAAYVVSKNCGVRRIFPSICSGRLQIMLRHETVSQVLIIRRYMYRQRWLLNVSTREEI